MDQTPLDRIATEIGIDYNVLQGNPKRTISGQLCRAIKHGKKCWNNSFQLCQQFLERLAGEWVTAKAPNQAAIVHRIKTAEHQKTMYCKLQTYLKPNSHGGLTQVDVPEWNKMELFLTVIIYNFLYACKHNICWWITISLLFYLF
eukprot:3736794-Ditylum_brightwellii.AAC.1